MKRVEEDGRSPVNPPLNPAIVEWLLPEEGLGIRLQIDHPGMEHLSPAAREKLLLALSRFVIHCDFLVGNEAALAAKQISMEGAFTLLAGMLKDVNVMYQVMAGLLADDSFPF